MSDDSEDTSDKFWFFSHGELLLTVAALFVIFFLGYFTRSWTEPSPKDDIWMFKPPSQGIPYSFTCEGHTGERQ